MSYRVWSYHKACLSLVLHGWLVVLLLGRRISSAKAFSPLISRCALETSADISMDEAGSINCTSSTYSTVVWKDNFTDCVFRSAACISSRQPTKQCVPQRVMSVWKWVPLRCWNRLWANQSRLYLNIPTARPIVWKRRRPLPWCQTRQSKHVAVSRKHLKEKSVCYINPKQMQVFGLSWLLHVSIEKALNPLWAVDVILQHSRSAVLYLLFIGSCAKKQTKKTLQLCTPV